MQWFKRLFRSTTPARVGEQIIASSPPIVDAPVTYQDYMRFIAPNLRRFTHIPDLSRHLRDDKTVGMAIYESTAEIYLDARQGCDYLMMCCDALAVQYIAKRFVYHFQRLRAYQVAGIKQARILIEKHACPACWENDGKAVSVTEWLALFERGAFPYPHPLPSDDTFNWCDGAVYFADIYEVESSGDPAFDAWLKEELKKIR